MRHIGLTHLPVGEYLGGFSFLVIVNVASMDICVTSICVSTVLSISLLEYHMVLLPSGMLKNFFPNSDEREFQHIEVLTNTCPSLS